MQNQQKIEWPAKLVVAKAYVDQLSRSQALPPDKITALQKAIQGAESLAHEQRCAGEFERHGASIGERCRLGENSGGCNTAEALAGILEPPAA